MEDRCRSLAHVATHPTPQAPHKACVRWVKSVAQIRVCINIPLSPAFHSRNVY